MERDPTTREGWFFPRRSTASCVPGAAQHVVMRCRPGIVTVRGGPGSALHHLADARVASHPGYTSLGRVRSLIHFSNSPSRSRGAYLRPGFCNFSSLTRIEGWAERRETFGCSAEHPWGLHMTRQARRLRGALRPIARQDARERAYDAGRSPLGAPPWRF
jgi:hypothetical protein